jgi:uncharacterized protein
VKPREILAKRDHRQWPLPEFPWIMSQVWHDLLFAHWPIPVEQMRPLVPKQLPLDTFDGRCWLGIAPFHMSGVRPRGMPSLPWISALPELNVRTYVTLEDKPGVYFFSLDAATRSAVWAARTFYSLPYFFAKMRAEVAGDEVVYSSVRESGLAVFRSRYCAISPVRLRDKGGLDHWLTERYCLYTVRRGQIVRAEIHHLPWPLQDAAAEIQENTMALAAGLTLPDVPPLLHFARKLEVLIWPPRTLQHKHQQ